VIGCWLLGDCSTDDVPTYDMNGFGNNIDRDDDYFDEFDNVSISDSYFYINHEIINKFILICMKVYQTNRPIMMRESLLAKLS